MSKFKDRPTKQAAEPAQAAPMGATLGALATADDVAALAGRDLTADEQTKLARLLQLASALVRNAAGQQLSQSTDTFVTEDVTPVFGLTLPQRPVTAVSEIRVNGEAVPVDQYDWTRTGTVEFTESNTDSPWFFIDQGQVAEIEVDYTHGYNPVPDEVAAITAALAWAQLRNPAALRSESLGDYSTVYSGPGDAIVPGLQLSADQKDLLRRYRRAGRSFPLSG